MAQLFLAALSIDVMVVMVVIVAIHAQAAKLAIHNVIQTINYYRLYINDI